MVNFRRTGFLMAVGMLLILPRHDAWAQRETASPKPILTILDPAAMHEGSILNGPPQTCTMRSGYVVLAPGTSIGKHSTRGNEEAVIALAGTGEMRMSGGPTLKITPYSLAYCPPFTEHDVFNTGPDTLRYIWLVAKAK